MVSWRVTLTTSGGPVSAPRHARAGRPLCLLEPNIREFDDTMVARRPAAHHRLGHAGAGQRRAGARQKPPRWPVVPVVAGVRAAGHAGAGGHAEGAPTPVLNKLNPRFNLPAPRSEERRVGKEWGTVKCRGSNS